MQFDSPGGSEGGLHGLGRTLARAWAGPPPPKQKPGTPFAKVGSRFLESGSSRCAHSDLIMCSLFGNADLDHLDWCARTITSGRGGVIDGVDDVHAADHLTEHGVFGLTWREVIQVGIVYRIDEELAAS